MVAKVGFTAQRMHHVFIAGRLHPVGAIYVGGARVPHLPPGVRCALPGVRAARRRGVRHGRLRQARGERAGAGGLPCADAPADDRAPPARSPTRGRSAGHAARQVSPPARRSDRRPARRVSGSRRGGPEPRRRRHGHLRLSSGAPAFERRQQVRRRAGRPCELRSHALVRSALRRRSSEQPRDDEPRQPEREARAGERRPAARSGAAAERTRSLSAVDVTESAPAPSSTQLGGGRDSATTIRTAAPAGSALRPQHRPAEPPPPPAASPRPPARLRRAGTPGRSLRHPLLRRQPADEPRLPSTAVEIPRACSAPPSPTTRPATAVRAPRARRRSHDPRMPRTTATQDTGHRTDDERRLTTTTRGRRRLELLEQRPPPPRPSPCRSALPGRAPGRPG